ncbi:MAG: TIR domain-containing protein [Thermoguttaceae bacterium]|nr:TIR domain-containing protein [Thermoguttaceae bacterium]
MEKAAKPLKIFISYGHEIDVTDNSGKPLYPEPNNESVVRKIKAYLESRGHTVWLDTDQIKEGKDWRRKIYEGVEESNVVIVCLSRKAMKPNGVCRDEIAIAIGVCGRNLFPVKLEESNYPSYLKSYQFITDFQEWSSHISADTIDETWLDQNLEKLAKLLEEENVRLYYDEIVELKNLLKPWNMNSRLKKLDSDIIYHYNEKTKETEKTVVNEFCGRESLFKMFEEQLVQGGEAVRKESQRVLWLRKGPGFGKSRFAAELHYNYCYAIRAAYFIEYNQPESFKPQTFVKSVAFQLAQANNSYRKKLLSYLKENLDNINLQTGDPQTLFKTLIVNQMVNDIDGDNGTQWILVDALDEATVDGRNEIASLISQNIDNLPSWICFFITSRDSDSAVNRNFTQFSPIEFSDEENKSNVREYILNEIDKRGITVQGDPEELVNILHEKSEGTFLYPEMVFRDLTEDSISLDDIRSLPSGVLGYIHKRFNYLYGNNIELYDCNVRPMLGYILTSCEPIPRGVLKYCLGIERDSEFNKRLKLLGTFFIHSGTTDKDTIVPFHKSIKDYCFDIEKSTEDYCIYPDEANEDFANRGLELYKSGVLQWTTRTDEEPDALQRYFLTWLPSHLMNANMKEDAAAVLSDFAFLMKRLRFGNVERVILDYILFRGKLERILKDSDAYFDVIRGNAHFLRRNREDNPAYKIMLQIATEIADDCPVTQAAEEWLNPKGGDSPCDWFWLNKIKRPVKYCPDPCKLVIENAGNDVKLLANGDALTSEADNKLRIWDLETGACKAVLNEQTDDINRVLEGGFERAIKFSLDNIRKRYASKDSKTVLNCSYDSSKAELRSGDILSWSKEEQDKLRLLSPNGACKSVWEGHTARINGALELRSGDILSWSDDKTLRLWSPDGACKAVLEGHTDRIKNAIELRSGNILSWCHFSQNENDKDYTLRLWSPNGMCKEVLNHEYFVFDVIELSSGDFLSWSYLILRLWSPEGKCKALLSAHDDVIMGAKELRSGDILSWSRDHTLLRWSPDGNYKAVMKGHKDWVRDAIELDSGVIASEAWRMDPVRLWSPDGTCKAVLEGYNLEDVIELPSGNILSKSSSSNTLCLWSPDGSFKAILEGHTDEVNSVIELRSGDILSLSNDFTLRLWATNISHKTIQEKYTGDICGVLELRSGNILSWCKDKTLSIWTPRGTCEATMEGHSGIVWHVLELRSGDILSWCGYNSLDYDLHIWSPDGTHKATLYGHYDDVIDAIELPSGNILSNSLDNTLRIWSPDGACKAVLKWQNGGKPKDAIALRSGDILLWCGYHSFDYDLYILSPDGTCKAVLRGHTDDIIGAIELRSGDILSWSRDKTLRLWSPDGTCKAVLEGHTGCVYDAKELPTGNILSYSLDNTIRRWSPDGICTEVIESDNPQNESCCSLYRNKQDRKHFGVGHSSWGIEIQNDSKPIAQWNGVKCNSLFVGAGRICVWYGGFIGFLRLNYGNHISVSFEQAHQLLAGEIDESKLVTFVPQPKGTDVSKTE